MLKMYFLYVFLGEVQKVRKWLQFYESSFGQEMKFMDKPSWNKKALKFEVYA